jgi:PAS domain-containing protein
VKQDPFSPLNTLLVRQLIAALPDTGVIVFNRELRCMYAGGEFNLRMGLTEDMLVGSRPTDFMSPQMAADLLPYYQAALAGVAGEYERTLNGVTCRASVLPLWGENDTVIGGIVLAHDITESRRAQQAAAERQTRLSLINSIVTGIRTGMSVDAVIEHTIAQIAQAFPTLQAAYSSVDADSVMRVVHAVHLEPMLPMLDLVLDLKIAPDYQAALASHAPFVCPDVQRDSRLLPLAPVYAQGGIRAVLDMPIHHNGRLVGLLCLDSPVPHEWSEHEIATLREVADYLKDALHDAALEAEREQAQAAVRQS